MSEQPQLAPAPKPVVVEHRELRAYTRNGRVVLERTDLSVAEARWLMSVALPTLILAAEREES